MLDEKALINLVGRYQLQEDGQSFLDDERDLHIIAIDPQAKEALVDFNACPEWLALEEEASGILLVDSKYRLNFNNMTYSLL